MLYGKLHSLLLTFVAISLLTTVSCGKNNNANNDSIDINKKRSRMQAMPSFTKGANDNDPDNDAAKILQKEALNNNGDYKRYYDNYATNNTKNKTVDKNSSDEEDGNNVDDSKNKKTAEAIIDRNANQNDLDKDKSPSDNKRTKKNNLDSEYSKEDRLDNPKKEKINLNKRNSRLNEEQNKEQDQEQSKESNLLKTPSSDKQPVNIEANSIPRGFYIQVGSFTRQSYYELLLTKLKDLGVSNVVTIKKDDVSKVLIGPYKDRDSAKSFRSQLANKGITGFIYDNQ